MKGVLYNSQYSVLLKLTRNWLNSKSRGTMLTHVEQVLSTEFCLVTFRSVSSPCLLHRHSYIQNKRIHIHSKYGSVANQCNLSPKDWKKYILVGLSSRTSSHSRSLARYTRVRVWRVLMIRRANKQNALLYCLTARDWHTVCGVIFIECPEVKSCVHWCVFAREASRVSVSSTWRFVQLLTLTTGESVQGSR